MPSQVKKNKTNAAMEAFINRISSGLKRTAVTSPSKWAESYRMMPEGLWKFDKHPWLRGMHDSPAEYNVGQKAAQMGYTETLLNLTFYTIDVLARDVLYVLPNKNPNASDFSSGRFDPALELSDHLRNLFSDVHNIGHKRAGAANLYIRGSQSRADLKSLPIMFLAMDEVAEFCEENIPLALQRTAGQDEKLRKTWLISTPTVEGFGISKYYNLSNKSEFVFPCPSCHRHITLKFPDSIVICGDDQFDPRIKESHLICYECKTKLHHEDKTDFLRPALWVPQISNRDWNGFTINQMYSPTISPVTIATKYFESLVNQADEVELYNSVLGLSHEVKGARISDEDIDKCMLTGKKNRNTDAPPLGCIITMGVDIGKWINYEIDAWFPYQYTTDINLNYKCVVIKAGKVKSFEELDKLMTQYHVLHCVVDANPERRKALEFAQRFWGRVTLCIFGRGVRGKTIQKPKDVELESIVLVDRSSWLDLSLGRFRNTSISLPVDTDREYRHQIQAPVKTYNKDDNGNPVAKYLTASNVDDHYAFSRCYAEIALALVPNLAGNQDIEEV